MRINIRIHLSLEGVKLLLLSIIFSLLSIEFMLQPYPLFLVPVKALNFSLQLPDSCIYDPLNLIRNDLLWRSLLSFNRLLGRRRSSHWFLLFHLPIIDVIILI